MSADLTTTEGVEEYVGGIYDGVREIVEKGEKVRPTAIVFARRDPSTGIALPEPVPIGVPMVSDDFGPEARDAYASALRHASVQLDAVGVLVMFESFFRWRDPETDERSERSEVIAVLVDHKQLGERSWLAYIDRDGDPSLGDHVPMAEAASKQFGKRFGRVNETGGAGRFARIMPHRWMS